jgi:predicted DCC family thiol-disulfide oxidoreductase YuxK
MRDEQVRYGYRSDPAVPGFPDDRPIIVFDGDCILCSSFARFILRHDHNQVFRLLPAQTPLGSALYRHYGLDPVDYETNLLIEDGLAYFKSTGSIRIFERLGLPWSAALAVRVVPSSLRDRLYDWIARNRFRILGRRDACFLTQPGWEDRFLG